MSIAEFDITGRAGDKAHVKVSEGSGVTVCRFSLAVHRGTSRDITDWFDVVVFYNKAVARAELIEKGDRVRARGHIELDVVEIDGKKHKRASFVATYVEAYPAAKAPPPDGEVGVLPDVPFGEEEA